MTNPFPSGAIPINPVNVGTTGVMEDKGPQQFFQMLIAGMKAMETREQLALERKRLGQAQADFELRSKAQGPALEGQRLDNEKKKRGFKEEDATLTAREEAHRIFTGVLPQINDPEAIGATIAGIKDGQVGRFFYDLVQEHFTTMNAAKPNFDFKTSPSATGHEYVGLNPQDPTKPVRTGVAAPNPNAPDIRIPAVTEREKASVAIMTATANATINRLETADPTIPQRLAQRLRNSRAVVGAIGKRIAGYSTDDLAILQEQQIEQSLQDDPALLEYYQSQKAYLGPTMFGLSGKVITGRDYTTQAPTFFAMGASNPATLAARRKARAQRIRGFAMEAGDAMNERMAELTEPEEYGYGPPKPKRKYRDDNPYPHEGP